jgi:hypothetical protein
MLKSLGRAFHVITSQTRNFEIERNLYHIRYVIPKRDCKLGNITQVEVKHDEIILTFENPEITQYINKKPHQEPEPELKYHYAS